MTDSGLLTPRSSREPSLRRAAGASSTRWRLCAAGGTAFALVGWTDVLLLWYPLRIGRADWEFATVSGTFDALPLGTIGILLVVLWLLDSRSNAALLSVAAALTLIVLALFAAFVLFGLSFATGVNAVSGETRWILVRAGVKTTLAAVVYIVLYGIMVSSLIRASRKDKAA